jgi:hypothetical protein
MIDKESLLPDERYFIKSNSNPDFWDWIFSKGTNFTCYVETLTSLNETGINNRRIDVFRTIITTIQTPLHFYFFYWSLLVFILHKFNFRKPVMQIILGHLVIRCTGNILEQFGYLYKYYYISEKVSEDVYRCKPEGNMHPFRWFLTRQIGTIFWYVGEIFADWYPLLRTKAIVKNKSIRIVYATCALFNLSKIILIVYHLYKSPAELYNVQTGVYEIEEMDKFYLIYWVIQLSVIYTSLIYEYSVYIVLKKGIFDVNQYDFGFLKKFKMLSEYRILVSAVVSVIFLPIFSVSIILKISFFYFKNQNLEFEFEEVRQSIANVQYYMIFIDQILLIYSNYESKLLSYKFYYSNINNNNNNNSNNMNMNNINDMNMNNMNMNNIINNNKSNSATLTFSNISPEDSFKYSPKRNTINIVPTSPSTYKTKVLKRYSLENDFLTTDMNNMLNGSEYNDDNNNKINNDINNNNHNNNNNNNNDYNNNNNKDNNNYNNNNNKYNNNSNNNNNDNGITTNNKNKNNIDDNNNSSNMNRNRNSTNSSIITSMNNANTISDTNRKEIDDTTTNEPYHKTNYHIHNSYHHHHNSTTRRAKWK